MSLYGERLPDKTIQWYAMLRYEQTGRIDGLVPDGDVQKSELWLRALREVRDREEDDVLLEDLVKQYFKLLEPNCTARQITIAANEWFDKDKENGFKFWALNRAVTTNGDNQVLAELDMDFKVRNVIINLYPESDFEMHETEGGEFNGYIHKSRLNIEMSTEVSGAELGQEEVVVVDSLTDSRSEDIPDDSTFITVKSPAPTYRNFRNEANILHQDPPMLENSRESLLLQKIEVLKRRLKESELLLKKMNSSDSEGGC